MHHVYGEAQGNGRETQRIYQEGYPQRKLPHHTTFASINRRLREYCSLEINKSTVGRPRSVRTPVLEEAVLDKYRTCSPATHVPPRSAITALCGEYQSSNNVVLFIYRKCRLQKTIHVFLLPVGGTSTKLPSIPILPSVCRLPMRPHSHKM